MLTKVERDARLSATPTHAMITPGRDLRIDFFRGFALICIFINYIPSNPLVKLTLRNFALADAAEIVVFLAGVSAAFAYARSLKSASS